MMLNMARGVLPMALCLANASAFTTTFLNGANSRAPQQQHARPTSSVLRMVSNIAVFGGNGLTGSEVVYQALNRDCKVTAFCRDPSKLKVPAGSGGDKAGAAIQSPNLRTVERYTDEMCRLEATKGPPLAITGMVMLLSHIIGNITKCCAVECVDTGTVTNLEDVRKVFADGDITGVVIALGGKTADVGKTMLTDGTTNIITAMKEKDVSRVAAVTSIGAGDSENQAPFFFKVLMYTAMKSIFEDKNRQEALFFSGPGKDLEFTIVRPGGLTVEPPTGVINVIKGEAGSISRADVADFILGAVEDADFPYLKQAPCISSVGGTSWVKDRSKAARGEMA